MNQNSQEKTKRAVIYCRVSTKEQVDEGNSLVSQERICRDYALKNGYGVDIVYIEQGESAKTANRTELQKLLTYCSTKKNNVNCVIIYKIDRLSRNTDDYSQIRLLLKKYSVEIKSVSEYFENTPAGRFMENIISNVAQFDNDVRTERSINGMREALKEGRYVWAAPLGYINVKEGGKSNIAQGPLAPLILEAFEEVAKNVCHIDEVRLQMIKKGLSMPSGNPVSKTHFYHLLTHELYTGQMKKFGETYRGLFKPIVTTELFKRVQLILKYRSRKNLTYRTENPDFPLRRYFIHPNGKKLTGAWAKGRSNKFPYYRFHEPKLTIRKEKVEEYFRNHLNKFKLNDQSLSVLKSKVKQDFKSKTNSNEQQLGSLQKRIDDLIKKETNLIDKNFKGVISDDLLKTQLQIIESSLIEYNAEINKIQAQKGKTIEELIDYTLEYIKEPYKKWVKSSLPKQLQLQWFYFPQGVTFDGMNCRTTEMCCILKLKSLFSDHESGGESLRLRSTNHKPKLKLDSSLLTNEFLDELHSDLSKLEGIIKGDSLPEESN